MAYKQEYLQRLQEIRALISKGTIDGVDGALKKFTDYLSEIKSLGAFDRNNWNRDWRKEMYALGKDFSDKDATPFLKALKTAREGTTQEEEEVLGFIESEILWNFIGSNQPYVGSLFQDLCEKFPLNPEFHQSYSHYLKNQGDMAAACLESSAALKIEPQNIGLLLTYVNKEKDYFDELLLSGDLVKAEEIATRLKSVLNKPIYDGHHDLRNYLVSVFERLKDYKVFEKKLSGIDKLIEDKVEKVQSRFIEILGIFSAIIAFILTTTNVIIANLSAFQTWVLIVSLATVLLVFVVSLSFLFRDYKILKFWGFVMERKFWALVILCLILGGIGYAEYTFSTATESSPKTNTATSSPSRVISG